MEKEDPYIKYEYNKVISKKDYMNNINTNLNRILDELILSTDYQDIYETSIVYVASNLYATIESDPNLQKDYLYHIEKTYIQNTSKKIYSNDVKITSLQLVDVKFMVDTSHFKNIGRYLFEYGQSTYNSSNPLFITELKKIIFTMKLCGTYIQILLKFLDFSNTIYTFNTLQECIKYCNIDIVLLSKYITEIINFENSNNLYKYSFNLFNDYLKQFVYKIEKFIQIHIIADDDTSKDSFLKQFFILIYIEASFRLYKKVNTDMLSKTSMLKVEEIKNSYEKYITTCIYEEHSFKQMYIWFKLQNSIVVIKLEKIITFFETEDLINTTQLNNSHYILQIFNKLILHPEYDYFQKIYNLQHTHILIPVLSHTFYYNFNKASVIFNKIKFNTISNNIHYNNYKFLNDPTTIAETIIKTKPKVKKNKPKKNKFIDISNINNTDIIEITTEIIEDTIENTIDTNNEIIDEIIEEELYVKFDDNLKTDIQPIDDGISVVTYSKYKFQFSFNIYEFFEDKQDIIWLFNNLHNNNTKFYEFMKNYDTIQVLQDFHKDYNRLNKSIHITVKFANKPNNIYTEKYHAYILNNEISSITRIHNIL